MRVCGFHVEVDFSGEPFLVDFTEESGDEAEQGGFVGKEGSDAGSAFEFLIDTFDGIAGSQAALVGAREGEDGEGLRDVFLHPGGEFGSGLGVGGNEVIEAGLGGGEIRAVKDGADICGHTGAHVQTWDISLGVLLEMELAALPGDGGEDGGASRVESAVSVADEEGEAVEAAGLEGGKEGTPVSLGLAQSRADAENGTFSIRADPNGDEHGAIQELATLANLFVSGIQDDVGAGP